MRTGRKGTLEPDPDSWALVTGATSGIGAAYARELGKRGYRLILTGRRAAELGEVVREIGEDRAEHHLLELSEEGAIDSLLAACRGRAVDALVNNAGFGIGKPYLSSPLAEERRMERVHVGLSMRLIHALAPGMVARGRGAIVNVASLAAFVPLPRSATYAATKAFLRVFSESLAIELRGTGVRVQALCPGFTRTNFHAALPTPGGPPDRLVIPWMSAEAVVSASIRALEADRVICIPGFWNRVIRRVVPLIPRPLLYAALATRR